MSRFMFGLSLASLSLSALAAPYLAVGQYQSADDPTVNLPMLVQSQDGGNTWSFNDVSGLDAYTGAYLPAGDCNDTICIAAGPNTGDSNNPPLLLQSQDGGNTWNFVSFSDTTLSPSFYAATCDQSTCLVSGLDNDTGDAVIAVTTDGGNTWALNDVSSSISGDVFDLECVDGYCAAVGSNSSGAMVAQSFDGGNTWTEVTVSGATGGALLSVDCNANSCVAAGVNQGHHLGLAIPMIVQSSNDKSLWAVEAVGGGHRSGIFYSVSCNETTCAATGNSPTTHMLLATSTNGSGWSYEHLGVGKASSGYLIDVDCNDQFCAAVGTNHLGNAVIMSNASGNWLVDSNSTAGMLFHIGCDDTLCFAGGTDSNGSPLLMENMQGAGWGAVSVNNAPAVGSFYAGSSSQSLIK